MPEALVRGVHINYEVIGASGPWIALTPGSRRSYGELVDLSKAIAAAGYRVLLHDRRNCGASDVAFDGSGSEHEVWADDRQSCRFQESLAPAGHDLDEPLHVGGHQPLAVCRPHSDALAEVLAVADRLHAAGARELDVLSVVILGQPVDRLLAAGDAPQQKAAQRVRVSDRKQYGEPCAG